jgi:hypothetical protein
MVTWSDFTLDMVTTAFFTPDHAAFLTNRAVATILGKFGEEFPGDMQALPLPAGVPPEIPRVVLQDADGRRRLSVAPARFDSVWNLPGDDSRLTLEDAATKCAEVQQYYVNENRVRVGRLALIVHRVCRVADPARVLIERFCNEASRIEPFNRSAAFEVHNHKEYTLRGEAAAEWRINSWVRCKSARLLADDTPVILVEQDLNTVASETESRRFDAEDIGAFFRHTAREADEILRKYFPG